MNALIRRDPFREMDEKIDMNILAQDRLRERSAASQTLTDSYVAATKAQSPTVSGLGACWARNILVLVNAGNKCDAALRHARWFADRSDGKVIVLFVTPSASPSANPDKLREAVIDVAGISRDQIASIFIRQKAATCSQILNTARREAADLMIIPAGFRWATTYFWAADSLETLIRHAPCPILVVGDDESRTIPDKGERQLC
ncbi:MAG TPA: universal stress protein [Verrucomicrobiae bacterium]|nr:universal stress protein [Verrucomicrobiae bacterium]